MMASQKVMKIAPVLHSLTFSSVTNYKYKQIFILRYLILSGTVELVLGTSELYSV